ncbi:MAG: hypothetical protein IPN95_09775 [Bacteroidetes bacterium]|nr:hypothetical protein [Bacteroidota bacterium]
MITLTDQQLEFLEQEIQQRGISHPGLGDQLLDHFACGIEDAMEAGLGFHEAYHKVYMQVSPNGLEEIDHSMTLVILHQKYSLMKKFVFSMGFSSAFLFGVGYIFKNMHWPWANIMIMGGALVFTFAFLPMYFRLKYNADKAMGRSKPVLNYVFSLLLVMVLAAVMPYKQFNMPGSSEVFVIGQSLLAFVLFPKVFLGWYRKFNESAGAVA